MLNVLPSFARGCLTVLHPTTSFMPYKTNASEWRTSGRPRSPNKSFVTCGTRACNTNKGTHGPFLESRAMCESPVDTRGLVCHVMPGKAGDSGCMFGAADAPWLHLPAWPLGLCSEGSAARLQHLPRQQGPSGPQTRSKIAQVFLACLGHSWPHEGYKLRPEQQSQHQHRQRRRDYQAQDYTGTSQVLGRPPCLHV